MTAAGFVVVVVMYAALSRLWTDTESPWYRSLTEPPWQPPDVVFGIVWPLNFLALLVVGVVVSFRRRVVARRMLVALAVSVVFALGWSYLFSEVHSLAGAAFSLVVAAALTWALFGLAWRAGRGYAAGLVVYTAWMSLAASLSVGFVALN
jgi:tryptophan-rich sensory protein